MTKYDKIEDFYDTKIELDSPEKVRKFQEKIFSLGGTWANGSKEICLDSKYLYYETGVGLLQYNGDKLYFNNDKCKQIYYEDIFPEEQEFKKGDIVYLKGTKSTIASKWNEDFHHEIGMKCEIIYIFNDGDLGLFCNEEDKSVGIFSPQDVSREPIENNKKIKNINPIQEVSFTVHFVGDSIKDIFKIKEENKMELKNMNVDNLRIAKQQFEEEKANEEIRVAKAEYARLADRLDTLNREIKVREEEKKEIQNQMKLFDEKQKKR